MQGYKARQGISLQPLVAGSIVFAMVAVTVLLLLQGKQAAERLLISAGTDAAQQLSRTIDEQVRRLLQPAEVTLRLLSIDPMAEAQDMATRMDRLPVGFEVLDSNPVISAFYMGYTNGEFLLVRSIDDPSLRRRFSAPPTAVYMVQTIHRDAAGDLIGEWWFYDASRRLLERRSQPGYHYDPRTRPWYLDAAQGQDIIITRPYVFFTTREVGITLARTSARGRAVVGLDAALADLGPVMQRMRLTPGTEATIVSPGARILAYPDMERLLHLDTDMPRLPLLEEVGIPSLAHLFTMSPPVGTAVNFNIDGQTWYGIRMPLAAFPGSGTDILISIPGDELLADARRIITRQALLAILLVLLFLPAGWYLGRRIARPMKQLADRVGRLTEFDFTPTSPLRTRLREACHLDETLQSMSQTINNFLRISQTLSREKSLVNMLDSVLEQLVTSFRVDGGAIYLLDDASNHFQLVARYGHFQIDRSPLSSHFQLDAEDWQEQDAAIASIVSRTLSPSDALYTQVLRLRDGELQGFLVLTSPVDEYGVRRQDLSFRSFVEELSGTAAVAIETRQMFEAQKKLLDAVIRLLADAIDAKSPYTSGHCERVPVLATRMIERLNHLDTGPFADFQLGEEEMEAFHMAAWLHDCGKITSPEHMVDKATKLETLYNRIHEIRTRFEVLLRDARIDYWRGLAEGGDAGALTKRLAQRELQLQSDYALIAQANLGAESMDEAHLDELRRIAQQRWWRHFDNRIGLSSEELRRMADRPPDSLPVEEALLQDRHDHIVRWGERRPPVTRDDPRNLWGFDMSLPRHAMNLGELHNLSIPRGTLTDEERFHINDHIVQTIIMLNRLPLPRHLRPVPEIAGNHHEKLDGTGYPRRLNANQLSIPARVLAIADVFEALTAADRPYKPAKTLSESLRLMADMAHRDHLDPELFEVFIRERLYLQYAERYLRPEQIDYIDEDDYLEIVRGARSPVQPGNTRDTAQ
ncbi:HD domain-containing phosphohydrolase [Thioalkalivibrio sulfidiphilus]|uniref:HD domain-containing phosphohydrolase n=1 Tax=Thioalkalivibrio sulfidiphilus TaxID=1033854 RepID=UPI003B2FBB8D